MKRLISGAAVLAALAVLAGCGSSDTRQIRVPVDAHVKDRVGHVLAFDKAEADDWCEAFQGGYWKVPGATQLWIRRVDDGRQLCLKYER